MHECRDEGAATSAEEAPEAEDKLPPADQVLRILKDGASDSLSPAEVVRSLPCIAMRCSRGHLSVVPLYLYQANACGGGYVTSVTVSQGG